MSVSVFLELVEAKAKIASVFPFFMGLFYANTVFHHVNWSLMGLFFVAMLLFNMAVDAHDNYSDYRHATAEADEWKQQTNIIGVHHLSLGLIRWLIILFAGTAALIGIVMVALTGWPLLVMGMFCFAVGYFYAAGPRPISTTPFGEVTSGLTMGFVICLITVYLNLPANQTLTWTVFWQVLLVSGLAVFAISNIMLANNLSDADEDRLLKRKTIVYYVGKPAMLKVFSWSYVLGYGCLIVSVVLHLLPWFSLLVLLSAPIVLKNTRYFLVKQVKKETFKYAVQNALVIALFSIISGVLGMVFN
ncbi:1,4-dihydroxy-2-naphthoate polyprenyltransferase [Secundilactobacillus kimchicus]|uniref:1,4-dihydroxy-2-naphthoate polyprenyltransferase n=1 Tax=Secundilactobacillus kimchicus TaxID=528209 RepID=UPI001C00AE2C|nr:1,4-dihydroxy-2-naphthoate polyprenyltransferase [Secundilactobacillus kimchicus]MBT9671820.1 1,4-dihydroxy-2-naphthoate polyprenyltransferase [Secundilactobacillus kimchicus]